LPGATGPVSVDYIVYDQRFGRIWIPVGETGSVDVFDIGAGTFAKVDGFRTAQREAHGRMRTLGPSAVTIGDGFAYIGDRATGEVCPVSEKTLVRGTCLTLPTPTDGVAYVASAKELWVTTPRDRSLTVLDASAPENLRAKLVIKTPGEPEGYAVDSSRGLFYTNLEDENRTLSFAIVSHALKANVSANCGPDGPRGIAIGPEALLFVACTDGIRVLDTTQGGKAVDQRDTGPGVDNIDYVAESGSLIVAAGKAARLRVFTATAHGLAPAATELETTEGARNAVGDARGAVYVVDPKDATLLVYAAPGGAAPAQSSSPSTLRNQTGP
jgi:DNA-binding beta-propeller fold protein YncE